MKIEIWYTNRHIKDLVGRIQYRKNLGNGAERGHYREQRHFCVKILFCSRPKYCFFIQVFGIPTNSFRTQILHKIFNFNPLWGVLGGVSCHSVSEYVKKVTKSWKRGISNNGLPFVGQSDELNSNFSSLFVKCKNLRANKTKKKKMRS